MTFHLRTYIHLHFYIHLIYNPLVLRLSIASDIVEKSKFIYKLKQLKILYKYFWHPWQ